MREISRTFRAVFLPRQRRRTCGEQGVWRRSDSPSSPPCLWTCVINAKGVAVNKLRWRLKHDKTNTTSPCLALGTTAWRHSDVCRRHVSNRHSNFHKMDRNVKLLHSQFCKPVSENGNFCYKHQVIMNFILYKYFSKYILQINELI